MENPSKGFSQLRRCKLGLFWGVKPLLRRYQGTLQSQGLLRRPHHHRSHFGHCHALGHELPIGARREQRPGRLEVLLYDAVGGLGTGHLALVLLFKLACTFLFWGLLFWLQLEGLWLCWWVGWGSSCSSCWLCRWCCGCVGGGIMVFAFLLEVDFTDALCPAWCSKPSQLKKRGCDRERCSTASLGRFLFFVGGEGVVVGL